MSNTLICFPNRADQATLSGGTWETTLPRADLQNRTLGKVARTSNLLTASTQFDIDLGEERFIRALSLVSHNLTLDALIRVRGANAPDFSATEHDSGWIEAWPVAYPFGVVRWGEVNWWDGKYTDEERAGYTATFAHILAGSTRARYWRVEIDDTTNADGYIQIGRLFLGDGWQPDYNMSYRAGIGWETGTEVQLARSGAEYFDRRTPHRVVRFALEWMSEDEGLVRAFELFRRAGIDQEVFYAFDPADTTHVLRRQFLGRLRQLSAIEFPHYSTTAAGFEIKELL